MKNTLDHNDLEDRISDFLMKKVRSQSEAVFKQKIMPLKHNQSFQILRQEIEKKLNDGYTYQDLSSRYPMPKRFRRHLESLHEQIVETGKIIKVEAKKQPAKL